jgi:ABC-type sugar transport system permease subunit
MSLAPSDPILVATPTLADPTRPRPRPGRRLRRLLGDGGGIPYLFLSPYLATTSLFFVVPLIWAAVLAFHQTNGPASSAYVGLANFKFVLGDRDFYTAVWNTAVFTVCSATIQLPLSLGLAMLLNARDDRLKSWFRLVMFLPNLVGQVFVGVLFSVLFTPTYGLFNRTLQELIGWGLQQRWLDDPANVMPAVIIASLWLYAGFNMLYFLAALQNVDQSLVEACRMDGAGPVRTFFTVTVPAIMPVATFVVVTSTIGSRQLFELPYTLLQEHGGGYGPRNSGLTIVGYLYRFSFGSGDLGTGAAVGWLLTLLILVVSLIQIRVTSAIGRET